MSNMQMILFDDGVRRLSVNYVQLRRKSYYYRRAYPRDLKAHFGGATDKVLSLQTRDPAVAARKGKAQADLDTAEWQALRTHRNDPTRTTPADVTRIAKANLRSIGMGPGYEPDPRRDPLGEFLEEKHGDDRDAIWNETHEPSPWDDHLDPVDREMMVVASGKPVEKRLSDALAYYLKEHPKGRQKKFAADKRRSIGHVVKMIGDWPLSTYRRVHAETTRDKLLGNDLKTQSVRRHISDIAAVFAKGIRGFDLQIANHPFTNVTIIAEKEDATKKPSFTLPELQAIATAARLRDDPLRYMAALLINTGTRMSEIVGLQVADIVLEHEVPHVIIQPHMGLVRPLKNKASCRTIPLVGVSLWAAERAVAAAKLHGGVWLFHKYVTIKKGAPPAIQSGSAGTAMNNWIKVSLRIPKTSHCFRHTIRTRMTAAEVPDAIQDRIGGWTGKTIGQSYGDGQALEVMYRWLLTVAV